MKAKRKPARRFLTGYKAASQATVWGQQHFLPEGHVEYRIKDYCELMTKTEACKALKQFLQPGAIIYEVVPVEV